MTVRTVWIAAIIVLLVLAGFAFFESGRSWRAGSPRVQPSEKASENHSVPTPAKANAQYAMIAGGLPPCSMDVPVSLDNIEKFNWSYCEFNLRPFWRSLRIPPDDFESSPSLFQVSSSFGDLDGDNVDERILHLRHTGVCRIVVLKRQPQDKWISLGFLDIPTFHLDPEARIVTNGRGHWLAVSHNTEAAWGSGIFQEDETWYALEGGRFGQVLSFPAEGHLSVGWKGPVELRWETNIRPVPFDGFEDRIDLDYTMTLSSWNGKETTGRFHQIVSFAKSPSSSRFAFDTKASKMSEGEFLSVYHVGEFSWPHFLTAAREEIRRLAGGNTASRQLLRDLLDICRNTIQDVSNCDELTRSLEQ